VMVAVANSQAPGLQGFLDSIKALNIPNFMARHSSPAHAERCSADVACACAGCGHRRSARKAAHRLGATLLACLLC
jgi:hypothetical protein